MAKTLLRKGDRETLYSRIINVAFDDLDAAHDAETRELMSEIIRHNLSKEERDLFDQVPPEWLCTAHYLAVPVAGKTAEHEYSRVYLSVDATVIDRACGFRRHRDDLPRIPRGLDSKLKVLPHKHPLAEKLRANTKAGDVLQEKRETTKSAVANTLASMKTIEQFEETWPEGADVCKDILATIRRERGNTAKLPVSRNELNKLTHLPKPEKAAA